MARSDSRLPAKDFIKAQCLRVVMKQGVGVDNIDLTAAKKRGFPVHNTPAPNSKSVAELSMALTMALTRRVSEIDRAVRGGATVIRSQTFSTSMYGKTVGVVGMENIEKIVAQKWIGAFDCSVVAYDPFVSPDAWSVLDHTQCPDVE
ncbi:hypothetical protein BDV29DRAFT_159819 [Aspergillus leporis]|jgi:D-3-phosphoglycerate dehydrogenase|uniref:D-isomer specific 2-hydroxyacid dehydrogenase catalytic domain-containing protein n=1 Tax=Aspergillus leporis TaxID=41062 RepID=A0A5N5WVI3_9EURO|nr:hypothetical protein BDV29DRAFT_159819 [Aspergillus leporis]